MHLFFHSAESSLFLPLFLSLFLSLSLSLEGTSHANTSPLAPSWCINNKLTAPNRRLYISTLNGDLTAFDLSVYSVLWSHSSNIPLYSSTLGYSEPDSHYPNLIPGLDKNMYSWDGAELTKLPYSVDDLIDQSFTSAPGLVRAGARSKDEVAINVGTGKPLYKCTQFSCDKYDNNSLIGKMDRLLLTSHRTTVREAKSLTGDEIWNFTLSQVFVSLIDGEEEDEGGDPLSCLFDEDHTVTVQTENDKGLIIIDKLKKRSFDLKFSSPVSTVWYQFGNKLQKLELTPTNDPSDLANKPALLLGTWKQQYYILPVTGNQSLQLILNAPPTSGRGHTNCATSFLPLLPSNTLTSNDVTLFNKDSNWIQTLHTNGPNGLALYFYPKDTDTEYGYCIDNNSSNETTPTSDSYLNSYYYLLKFKSWLYVLTKYGIFALFVLGVNKFRRYQMKRLSTSSTSSSDTDDEVFEQTDGECSSPSDVTAADSVKRRSSSSSTLKASNTYLLLPTVEEETDHTLMDRMDSNESNSSTVTSRFETDYDRLGTLGKGGFGVVYHVINKYDNNEYAIKRIKLPAKKSSRDKVMREVHALARLEHKAIVRYFNSWVEQAPPGWNNREEWTNISRANSIIQMDVSELSSKQQSLQFPAGHNSLQYSSYTDSLSSDFKLRRPQSTDSVTSFTIEFRDESNSKAQVDSSIHSSVSTRSLDVCTNDERQIEMGGSSFYDVSDAAPPTFLFIQMQLCRKESLKEWLRNNVHNRQRRTMLDHFKQVLDAVVYVHTKGMMHRDLKPSNIFFSLDGCVKIGDFGLVTGNITPDTHRSSHIGLKQLTDDVDGVSLTGNIGTHFYISPEQVNGLQYDQKVDVFSLGVILFELNYPFVTEMERVKVLEDLRKNKIPSEFRKYLPIEASLVEWLMSPLSVRPSSSEVASSDRLSELQELNDFTLIPKL